MTSRQSIERRLDRLESGGDYPKLSLAQLLSADEIKTVAQEPGVVRIDGTIMDGSELLVAMEDNL